MSLHVANQLSSEQKTWHLHLVGVPIRSLWRTWWRTVHTLQTAFQANISAPHSRWDSWLFPGLGGQYRYWLVHSCILHEWWSWQLHFLAQFSHRNLLHVHLEKLLITGHVRQLLDSSEVWGDKGFLVWYLLKTIPLYYQSLHIWSFTQVCQDEKLPPQPQLDNMRRGRYIPSLTRSCLGWVYSKQWAAVTTHSGESRVPPHFSFWFCIIRACQHKANVCLASNGLHLNLSSVVSFCFLLSLYATVFENTVLTAWRI